MVEYKYYRPEECHFHAKNLNENGGIPEIVYLKVIKKLHWLNEPHRTCDYIPIGAITWSIPFYFNKSENGLYETKENKCIIIENNRYFVNFDPSCFEVLHTSIQKIKK